MDIFRQLWLFVQDVVCNWAGYSTGGVIVAGVAAWLKWRNMPMRKTLFFILSIIFLIVAFFKAWQRQFQLRLATEKIINERLLEGTILRFNVNQPDQNQDATLFLFEVEVRNKSMTDTIADDWNLDVIFPGDNHKHQAGANFAASGQYRFTSADGFVVTYSAENDLRVRGSVSPIPHGGKITGTVSFVLVDLKKEALPIGAILELTFKDVMRTKYVCGGFTNYRLENRLKGPWQPMPGIKP